MRFDGTARSAGSDGIPTESGLNAEWNATQGRSPAATNPGLKDAVRLGLLPLQEDERHRSPKPAPYDIAVVSMAGLYPGAADLDSFAQNVMAGRDMSREVPAGRWVLSREDALAETALADRTYSSRACFVEDLKFEDLKFENLRFENLKFEDCKIDSRGLAISAELTAQLDPLFQWVLHVGNQAWRQAKTETIDRSRVGVALAAIALPTDSSSAITREILGTEFERRLFEKVEHQQQWERGDLRSHTVAALNDGAALNGGATLKAGATLNGGAPLSGTAAMKTHPLNAHVVGLPAGLLAHALGLGGGACTLDAACASSLYAIKIACDELTAGRVDAMLAGGVSRPEALYTQMGFAQLQALSPSGRCSPFDARADGLVVGEGCGIVMLKRLDDALAHGDYIHGVIRAVSLTNDMAGSLLAADREGQVRAMRAAYAQAGWRPDDVDHIECHGTGTPLGDAVEFGSLCELWADVAATAGQCAIGSVKSMIGHTLTAAGVAGLHKTLIGMAQEQLPPSANFERAAGRIPLRGSPFRVQKAAAGWKRRSDETPRRGAVSAFGFGGINAHLLVEEFVPARAGLEFSGGQTSRGHTGAPELQIGSGHGGPPHFDWGHPGAPELHSDRGRGGPLHFDCGRGCPPRSECGVALIGLDAVIGRAVGREAFARAALQERGESSLREALIGDAPALRWRGVVPAQPPMGAFIETVRVPLNQYRLPPNEIEQTLPQQLLMLNVVAGALRDAGLDTSEKNVRAGVIIGIGLDLNTSNYHLRWMMKPWAQRWARQLMLELSAEELETWSGALRDAAGPALNAPRVLGSLGSIVASRIARELGFGGPSFAISATENSGLRALEYATRAIQRGELDYAVVGAVDLGGDVRAVLVRQELAGGAAFVVPPVGEGAVAMVLARGDLAERSPGAYALVRGVGCSSGGGIGQTGLGQRVDSHGQSASRGRALAEAGLTNEAIGVRECGEIAEVIGDCGAVAGLASVARVALGLQRGGSSGTERAALVEQRGLDGTSVAVVLVGGGQAARAVGASLSDGANAQGESSAAAVELVLGGAAFDPPLPGGAGGVRSRAVAVAKGDCLFGGGVARIRAKDVFQGLKPLATDVRPPGEGIFAASTNTSLVGLVAASGAEAARAHQQFLVASARAVRDMASATDGLARAVEGRDSGVGIMTAKGRSSTGGAGLNQSLRTPAQDMPTQSRGHGTISDNQQAFFKRDQDMPTQSRGHGTRAPMPLAFDRRQCLEFARGEVANVLGREFAAVDEYPVRVRLPDEPLMLVDRIVGVDGVKGSLSRGRVITEHDVLPGAWYLDGGGDAGRAPVCIAVEAGQADLFLCSYLGIDLAVRGQRAYRLLDATVEFHRGLPRAGETIRYEIYIDKFVRQGDAYLFFFRFEGTIAGQRLISMRDGCAGFFTTEEIERSGGIIAAAESDGVRARGEARGYDPLPPALLTEQWHTEAALLTEQWHTEAALLTEQWHTFESYSDGQIHALRRGDLTACFGPAFSGLPLRAPVRLPDGRMRLLNRVRELDLQGGRHGLGRIIAEADIVPDAWFLTCHFVDDMVMPGTLMYECCAHTLRVLLMRLGWVGEAAEIAYEPVQGVAAKLKCRGPVTPATRQVTYQVDIKEIGYGPAPYVIADALMCADGRPIVTFTDMSLQLTGTSRERMEQIWSGNSMEARAPSAAPLGSSPGGRTTVARDFSPWTDPISPESLEAASGEGALADLQRQPGVPVIGTAPIPNGPCPGLFTKAQILAFSNGNPSDCFGEAYRPFDGERRIARLPGPPYQVLDRITRIDGPRANVLAAGGWIEAQYDVPGDGWYFAANRQASMPFAILLEVALQPCGWLAAFVGSALNRAHDLRFRNLGGTAAQQAEVFADEGTLTTRVRLTDVSEAAGMILEKFDFQVWRGDTLVYAGDTLFGFFTTDSLAQQVGIRDAAKRVWNPPAQGAGAHDFSRAGGETEGGELVADAGLALRTAHRAVAHGTAHRAVAHGTAHRAVAHTGGELVAVAGLALPARGLRMLDGIERFDADGGPHGLGFVRGWKDVDPAEWFFKAHFYQDPVIPGSLGLESFLQLLKFAANQRWGAALGRTHRFEPIALGIEHTWRYRGQVIPTNRRVTVDAVVKRREDEPAPLLVADGFLSVDGRHIYEMIDFGLRLVPCCKDGADG